MSIPPEFPQSKPNPDEEARMRAYLESKENPVKEGGIVEIQGHQLSKEDGGELTGRLDEIDRNASGAQVEMDYDSISSAVERTNVMHDVLSKSTLFQEALESYRNQHHPHRLATMLTIGAEPSEHKPGLITREFIRGDHEVVRVALSKMMTTAEADNLTDLLYQEYSSEHKDS